MLVEERVQCEMCLGRLDRHLVDQGAKCSVQRLLPIVIEIEEEVHDNTLFFRCTFQSLNDSSAQDGLATPWDPVKPQCRL